MVKLYGIKVCDTCRKALKSLEKSGFAPEFHDVRDAPLEVETLETFLSVLGSDLLNTRSTTWRGLSEAERTQEPIALLQAHPTLMKRPVIDHDGTLTLGWGKPVQASFGV